MELLWQISVFQGTESKSQLPGMVQHAPFSCGKYRYFKELKANHNRPAWVASLFNVVANIGISRNWKQITTIWPLSSNLTLLWQISVFQGTESKSQLLKLAWCNLFCCGKYRYFKELKANHNLFVWSNAVLQLWQISVFQGTESKSQLARISIQKINSCGKYRYFKELKANHNYRSRTV